VTAARRHATTARNSADCSRCALEGRCWPELEFNDGPVPVVREAAVRSGEYLWRPGDAFIGPLIVHSGCVMIYRLSPAGEEQVLQFALPADLIGLEGYARGHHDVYARAQGEVLCCRISCPPATAAAATPALTRRLLLRASNILWGAQGRVREADPTSSVLGFLREICERVGHEEGESGRRRLQARLPMSRLDIGHYLGFAEETVCRAIRRLQERQLIEVRGRQISLLEGAWRPS
jgi:CRP/FNR family transcriptional regulator